MDEKLKHGERHDKHYQRFSGEADTQSKTDIVNIYRERYQKTQYQ
ncbi:MAG: hypothetical protein V4651_01880 [Bacteroidota bacterium]